MYGRLPDRCNVQPTGSSTRESSALLVTAELSRNADQGGAAARHRGAPATGLCVGDARPARARPPRGCR
jgi:hypothetical protein